MKKKYWWFETKWHQKMVKALQVVGMSESLQSFMIKLPIKYRKKNSLIILSIVRRLPSRIRQPCVSAIPALNSFSSMY